MSHGHPTQAAHLAEAPGFELRIELDGCDRRATVDPRMLLIEALRESFDVTGPKIGCLTGDCGACTVSLDGEIHKACLRLAISAQGATVRTIGDPRGERVMESLKQAFRDEHSFQCGYCLSGMLWSAAHLLWENPQPTEAQIREAISGNLCRCTGYVQIIRGVQLAAEQLRPDPASEPGGRDPVPPMRSEQT